MLQYLMLSLTAFSHSLHFCSNSIVRAVDAVLLKKHWRPITRSHKKYPTRPNICNNTRYKQFTHSQQSVEVLVWSVWGRAPADKECASVYMMTSFDKSVRKNYFLYHLPTYCNSSCHVFHVLLCILPSCYEMK